MIQRGTDDFFADPVDFQVELDAGDSPASTGDFEIHVAVVIFIAHDVGKEREAIPFLDQTDGDAGHRIGNRDPRIHERQSPAADAGHAAGAIGLEDVGDDPDRVRELVWARNHRLETTLGQGTVADFAAARPTDRTAFADAERREIIIEHELFAVLFYQPVDALFIADRAQGRGHQCLGLSAGEDG